MIKVYHDISSQRDLTQKVMIETGVFYPLRPIPLYPLLSNFKSFTCSGNKKHFIKSMTYTITLNTYSLFSISHTIKGLNKLVIENFLIKRVFE